VVLETWFSGISELPFFTFVLMMQPIHLAIGIVEGLVTATVVAFVWKARPEILEMAPPAAKGTSRSFKPVVLSLVALAVFTGGFLSWFASTTRTGWRAIRGSRHGGDGGAQGRGARGAGCAPGETRLPAGL
jgi:cobalt/nickel transport system permease protein